ncbi:hypothetical protein AMTR_s00018p00024220 [Amborella trichopoda]|uniref:NAC-A/B domain-containing protein n=1 Tax=Amborella trichopoda TaxID=13333 RepID=W1PJB9_AMBTC|nr:hypothetical protein AMTR_s00018p00024220 [Amborella trichopoda]
MPGQVAEEEHLSALMEEQKLNPDEPIVEDVKDDESDEDEDDDDDDDKDEGGEQGAAGNEGSKQSRSEKKSRKAMLKLGMKAVTGVSRFLLAIQKFNLLILIVNQSTSLTMQILFVISKPDIFKSPNSETYVIFGEAKIEDLSSQLQTQAAQQFRMPDMSNVLAKPDASAAVQDDEEEDIDETGIEARDIDLVMTQAGVSRAKAIRALKGSDGDIVSAIMELTT